MGVRGELFSTKVMLQNRTYFFNVKENRLGDIYLNIVESKNRDEGGFDRQSVILFAEDLQQFLQGFDESLKVMEKAVREKRRPKSNDASTGYRQNRQNPDRSDNRDFDPARQEGPRRFKKRGRSPESREQRPRHESREHSPRHESREQKPRYEPREQSQHHESREHNPQHERKRKDAPRKKRVVVRKH
jgi:hypothetical protein